MDPLNFIKILAPLITVVIAFIAGFIELRLNPKNWLNRWFASFFFSASLAYLIYAIYHLLIFSPFITISIAAVVTQILFNFMILSLIMTVLVLEKFAEIAMSLKYLGIMAVAFILMSFGYFIWFPEVDPEYYGQGVINTITPPVWFMFVNICRMIVLIYVVIKYALIIKKTEGEAKNRIRWFFIGILFTIVGITFNLVGGIFNFILTEIITLILINIGAIIIVKGFFI